MKKLLTILIGVLMFAACNDSDNNKKDELMSDNPLLQKFDTPYEVPPFDKIKNEHFLPALEQAIKEQNEEIDAIVKNEEEPTVENTLVALDATGHKFRMVDEIFNNLLSANSNDEMRKLAKEISPRITAHKDAILLNMGLFKKVKTLYNKKAELNLSTVDSAMLEKIYKKFARGGADLSPEKQTRVKEINKKLSELKLQFGDNLLAETNAFELIIDKQEDLEGLPEGVIAAAAETAKEKGHEGKWMFTLHKPSLIPFLQSSAKRELREKMFKGYAMLGNNDNANDSKKVINEIVNLRLEKAKLFGFESYADYVLDDRMAKKSENVYELLEKVWEPALQAAKKDAKLFQKMIKKEGNDFKLEPWDWWYYAEKVKKEKYDLDDEVLRPYFELESSLNGMFTVLNKLFGMNFIEKKDVPKYHEDVRVFEVQDNDGGYIGILYMDFFPRESKRAGAWMTSFKKQYYENGKRVAPIITTVFNFSKPTGDKPALLTFEEVSTMYHEIGHCIHGLLSDVKYYELSGTAVARDFVELPSQIMENWAAEPEVLKIYAKHYQTGELIPEELMKKMKESGNFNEGFRAVEYLAASFLDLSWHMITSENEKDANTFEKEAMDKINLIEEIIPRYRSGYFAHIFRGGYATGYYSYIWAEVLDADAFDAFKENGIFDKATADAFKNNILKKGGSENEMILYKNFRGSEPDTKALLKRKGFK